LQGQSHGTAIEPGTTPPILLWIGWIKTISHTHCWE
jgi:hypothetical protein